MTYNYATLDAMVDVSTSTEIKSVMYFGNAHVVVEHASYEAVLKSVVTALTASTVMSFFEAEASTGFNRLTVKAASTANVAIATAIDNGKTFGGVTLATSDRILLKNQTNEEENGIYVVAASGAASRASDYNTITELKTTLIFVTAGTNADKTYIFDTDMSSYVTTYTVKLATTANIDTLTSGLDATTNLDSVAMTQADLVLVKDQTNPEENGIYVVSAHEGTAARETTFNQTAEIVGSVIFVTHGATNASKIFKCDTTGVIEIGVTELDFTALDLEFTQVTGKNDHFLVNLKQLHYVTTLTHDGVKDLVFHFANNIITFTNTVAIIDALIVEFLAASTADTNTTYYDASTNAGCGLIINVNQVCFAEKYKKNGRYAVIIAFDNNKKYELDFASSSSATTFIGNLIA